MELKMKRVGNVLVIYLSGRLDIHLSVNVEEEINRIIDEEQNSHLLLNLSNVEYMSSSGIRILVSTMRKLQANMRKMKICNMNNDVKKIFDIVELIDIFEIFDTETEALESFIYS
ncbi:MAG: STAS domain-containing protein [Spirochaetota bacterium]|nr:STAS domain-containing protein [Spirochaetota bacterium]